MKNKAKTVIYSVSRNHTLHHCIIKKLVLAGLIIAMQVKSVEYSFMSTIKTVLSTIIDDAQLKSRLLTLANKVNTLEFKKQKTDI